MYVLDTDVTVEYLKGNKDVVEEVLKLTDLFTTPVTVTELFYGVYRSPNPKKHRDRLMDFLEGILLLDITPQVSEEFGKIKAELGEKGKLAGDFDIMIASICIVNKCYLVTKNIKHYENIDSLKIHTL